MSYFAFIKILLLIAVIRQIVVTGKPKSKEDKCKCQTENDIYNELINNATNIMDAYNICMRKKTGISRSMTSEDQQKLLVHKDCYFATAQTRKDGVYKIQLKTSSSAASERLSVNCLYSKTSTYTPKIPHVKNSNVKITVEYDRGWLSAWRQFDCAVFNKKWEKYEAGFGSSDRNHFIGLLKLYELTRNSDHELLVVLQRRVPEDEAEIFAKYDTFAIGDKKSKYAIKVLGNYTGNAGDLMRQFVGKPFSTKDKKNSGGADNCAELEKVGWWYKTSCEEYLLKVSAEGFKVIPFDKDYNNCSCNYAYNRMELLLRPKKYTKKTNAADAYPVIKTTVVRASQVARSGSKATKV